MEIDAGLWIMACQKKPDMLMVSTRGCCCSRNVKNAGSRKLPSIALLRTTLGGLPFRNRHSARPALHLLLRLHAVERLCLSSAMTPRRNSPKALNEFRHRQGVGMKVNLLVNYGWE